MTAITTTRTYANLRDLLNEADLAERLLGHDTDTDTDTDMETLA